MHISSVIHGMIKELREKSHSYPTGMTEKQWNKKLLSIETDVIAYKDFEEYYDDNYEVHGSLYRLIREDSLNRNKRGIRNLSKIFEYLWD